jgi:predicted nucleotidyltransferase
LSIDFSYCEGVLADRGLLPDDTPSVYVVGSMARGWATLASDIDLVVVTTEPFEGGGEMFMVDVPLRPGAVPTVAFNHGDRRWEIRYWLDDQVDQLFEKVSWAAFDADRKVGDRLVETEQLFLERLVSCAPVIGQDWVRRRRDQLAESAFRSLLVMQGLNKTDARTRTALAQLAAGDVESAVLSARDAFGWAMDSLLDGHGEHGALVKWRARRFRAAAPKLLTFDEYWALETMRDYDPGNPGEWIRRVVAVCKQVSMEVEI